MVKEKVTVSTVLRRVLNLVAWLTGVLVSLAVGFSMTGDGPLNQSIPYLSGLWNGLVVNIAGWIVVGLTIISIVLAILDL